MGRKSISRRKKRNSEEQVVALAGFVLMMIIYIAAGILACKVALVPVCFIALLEIIIARCFYNLPIWVHLLIVILEIIAGALVGQALFAILAALVYFIAVFELCYLRRS